jgi:hypothetical protein
MEIVQLSSRPIVKPRNKRRESTRRRSSIEDPRRHHENLGHREVLRLRLHPPEEVTILMDLLLTIQEGEDLHGITSLSLIDTHQVHHSLVRRLGSSPLPWITDLIPILMSPTAMISRTIHLANRKRV